ncbi:MAG: ISAzo13 family transposase, partial [Deltaproteobacteria bacterium]|nr:ISAzo13 family transposase [Deltaproteobacteria bacterium]
MEERILRMESLLDERQWRLYLANEAMSAGYGGVSKVSRITRASRTTITKGIEELRKEKTINGKVRRTGGGPKCVEEKHPDIKKRILKIVDGSTYGNPERMLSYTTESLRKVETELESQGIKVSYKTIGKILDALDYSKQANQKMSRNGKPHPDMNAQFEHINDTAAKYLKAGDPVISVDTKKKENIGNFKNSGQECRHRKDPRKVLGHDFPLEELGKISP